MLKISNGSKEKKKYQKPKIITNTFAIKLKKGSLSSDELINLFAGNHYLVEY